MNWRMFWDFIRMFEFEELDKRSFCILWIWFERKSHWSCIVWPIFRLVCSIIEDGLSIHLMQPKQTKNAAIKKFIWESYSYFISINASKRIKRLSNLVFRTQFFSTLAKTTGNNNCLKAFFVIRNFFLKDCHIIRFNKVLCYIKYHHRSCIKFVGRQFNSAE